MKKEVCCPKFNPKPWNNKIFRWKNKRFIKSKALTFFYMPINFGGVIQKLMKKMEAAKANCPDYLMLSEHPSLWEMNLYLAVDRKIPGSENILINGKFFSRVYEGDFKETGNWMKDFKVYTEKKGLRIKKQYVWYTTCPKCAKKYGKNYIVLIAQID